MLAILLKVNIAFLDNIGTITFSFLNLNENKQSRNEKSSVTAMFERETRREKILEARNKVGLCYFGLF